jgi:acyl carrier protein
MSVALDRNAIDKLVTDTLVDFGVDRSQITADATFDDLEVDSLDIVELRQAVKREFAIDIRATEFDTIETIGQALALIYQRAGLG